MHISFNMSTAVNHEDIQPQGLNKISDADYKICQLIKDIDQKKTALLEHSQAEEFSAPEYSRCEKF